MFGALSRHRGLPVVDCADLVHACWMPWRVARAWGRAASWSSSTARQPRCPTAVGRVDANQDTAARPHRRPARRPAATATVWHGLGPAPAGHPVVRPPPSGPGLLAAMSPQAASHRWRRAGLSPPAHKRLVCTHPGSRQGNQSPGIGRELFPVEVWQLRLIPGTAQDGSLGLGVSLPGPSAGYYET